MIQHHAFIIPAEAEEGIRRAHTWVAETLGMKIEQNPDVIVLRYGLFSVIDARRVAEFISGKPFIGESKVVILTVSRLYHEAQNALLKIFEEPPNGVHIFLVVPSLGNLLPTLRSRVQILETSVPERVNVASSDRARSFLKAAKEKRAQIIRKMTAGKDEDQRREGRDEALQLVNEIEQLAYGKLHQSALRDSHLAAILSDIAFLRGFLYDRSAPVRMILEHLALVLPKDLL